MLSSGKAETLEIAQILAMSQGRNGIARRSTAEKAWEHLMGSELSRQQMCAWAAARTSSLLGCVNKGMARSLRRAIIPHYSAFVRPYLAAEVSSGPAMQKRCR